MSKLLSVHRALSIVLAIGAVSACADDSLGEDPNNISNVNAADAAIDDKTPLVHPEHEDAGMVDAATPVQPVDEHDASVTPEVDAAPPTSVPDASTATSDAGGPPPLPIVVADGTFAGVYTVLGAACVNCHGAGKPLDMSTPALAHAALVNVPASMKACAPTDLGVSYTRVVPFDLAQSLMIQKLEGHAPCGNPMPIKALLPDALVEVFRVWVSAGAPAP